MKTCIVCEKELVGKQSKYCSRLCHNQSGNKKHQDYKCQQKRGKDRKVQLVQQLGGQCEFCGYHKNYAALSFHHKEPSEKKFPLDLRNCSNKNWNVLVEESKKCQLLCVRCHIELHHPNF